MRYLASVSLNESTILFLCTLEWSLTQVFYNYGFHDGLKLSFHYCCFQEKRADKYYFPPHVFLLAFHLEWSFNTSVDKKSSAVSIFCELVVHFSLWFQLSIFFSLVIFSVGIHKRRGRKLSSKKLNLVRQVFKDVIWIS